MGFGLVIGFVELLQLITISNYSACSANGGEEDCV
jgi:hypothetical protein